MSESSPTSPSASKKPSVWVYKKLHENGTPDPRPLAQSDYDQVTAFIKETFPKATRVQKDIDQSLKRTFVLGRSEPKTSSIKKSIFAKEKSSSVNRKIRLRLQKKVPKRLPYKEFVELNSMWRAYVTDVLDGETNPQTKMNRLDFHGAMLNVAESICKDYINLKGIVIKETKNVFVIVTESNSTKNIPKRETIFDVNIDAPKGIIRISGNSLLTRPSERACKKIKSFIDYMSPKVYKSKLRYSDW